MTPRTTLRHCRRRSNESAKLGFRCRALLQRPVVVVVDVVVFVVVVAVDDVVVVVVVVMEVEFAFDASVLGRPL